MIRSGNAPTRVFIALVLAWVCAFAGPPALLAESLKDTVKAYDTLKNDHAASARPASWQGLMARFESCYKQNPDGPDAAQALYYMARIKEETGRRFGSRADDLHAADYFERISRRFPTHQLADDGLYRASTVALARLNDPERAKTNLRRILAEYSGGNYARLARENLDRLESREAALPRPSAAQSKTRKPESAQTEPAQTGTARSDSPAKPGQPKAPVPKPEIAVAPAKTEAGAELTQIRYRTSPDYTRVVLDLSRPVKFDHFILDKDKTQDQRLVVDLDGVAAGAAVSTENPVNSGIVKRIRTGRSPEGKARVVVDLAEYDHANVFPLLDPYRVVIDIFGPDRNGKPEAAKAPAKSGPPVPDTPKAPVRPDSKAPATSHEAKLDQTLREIRESIGSNATKADPKADHKAATDPNTVPPLKLGKPAPPAAVPAVPAEDPVPDRIESASLDKKPKQAAMDIVSQLGLKIRTIMIDPGHGGHDPGAIHFDLQEKDIVLEVSLALGQALKARGFNVLYTRSTDVFIPLEDRTAMANEKKADMFISIHCNASPKESASGLEVYYLNSSKSRDALRVASRENAISTKRVSDLQFILTELMLNYKIKESSALARQVRTDILKSVKPHFDIRDNGVREAPFYVLMGAKMPAILVELGYITNRQESRRLTDSRYQALLVDGLLDGVFGYKRQAENLADAAPSKKGG